MSRKLLTVTHWGTHWVEVEDDRLAALIPFQEDRDPSAIGQGLMDTWDDRMRVRGAYVRKSYLENGAGANSERRGFEPFVEVSYAQAAELVATEIKRIQQEHGNKAIYGGAYGWASAGRFHHAQSQLHRFLNCCGGYVSSRDTYSFAAAEVVMPHIVGGNFRELVYDTDSWRLIAEHTDICLCFGGMPTKNAQISNGGVTEHFQQEAIQKAVNSGVQFVLISPNKDDVPKGVVQQWLPIRPNTDCALLLALAYVVMHDNAVDQDFLARCAVGYEKFAAYLDGSGDGVVKSPHWAAEITGLEVEEINRLARDLQGRRVMISLSWSLTRQKYGEHFFWAGVTLAAMIGQIGLAGGGISFGLSATNTIAMPIRKVPYAALPTGSNPITDYIPVARISDALLNPKENDDYNGHCLKYPDLRMIYWAGGNPFHHHQDLSKLSIAWQKPETIVVHEWNWTPTARRADIVFGCAHSIERADIALAPRNPYLVCMDRAVAPVAGVLTDYEIYCLIARCLGVEQAFAEGKTAESWIKQLYDTSLESAAKMGIKLPEFTEFIQKGWYKIPDVETHRSLWADFRRDPTHYRLQTPSGKIELYSETVARFGYVDHPGHAAWMEPNERLGGKDTTYPLHLVTNQPANKLHSQLDHGKISRADKVDGREVVRIHPEDAERRGIKDRDVVRLFNDRGACLASARLCDQLRPHVVQMATGAWYDPVSMDEPMCRHGNPNTLTLDEGTSRLAQGPSALTCLVEIEKWQNKDQKYVANPFTPPEIIAITSKE